MPSSIMVSHIGNVKDESGFKVVLEKVARG